MFSNLAIAILNYEHPIDTINCILSILESENDFSRILVLDNGSKDDSVEQITNRFPTIKVVQIAPNRGYAGGMNAAIEECLHFPDVDRILLVSNDTVFEPDSIHELLKTSWDVAIPKILYYQDRKTIWCAGTRWRRFPPMIVMRGYQEQDSRQYDQPVKLDSATGCVFLVNRNVFEAIGGFDEAYHYYMEDYDFFYRVRERGFSIGYVPSSRIYHKVSLTLGNRSRTQFYYIGRNSVFFYRKYKRFSLLSLLSVIGWVTCREMLHGDFSVAWEYLRGILNGFIELKSLSENKKDRVSNCL